MSRANTGRVWHTVLILGLLTSFACDDQGSAGVGQGPSNNHADARADETGLSDPSSRGTARDSEGSLSESDDAQAESDDTQAESDDTQAESDDTQAESDGSVNPGASSAPSESIDSERDAAPRSASDAATPPQPDASDLSEADVSLPRRDGGIEAPVDTVGADPFAVEPVPLDERVLSRCAFEPLPSDDEAPLNCDECSDDLRHCPVTAGVAVVDSYLRAVSALGRDADRMDSLLKYLLEQGVMAADKDPAASIEDDIAVLAAVTSVGFDGRVEGSTTVEHLAPSCSTAVTQLRPFATLCDPGLDPEDDIRCAGECSAPADSALACPGSAQLTCSSSGVSCGGSCVGECQSSTGSCPGRCLGECVLDGSVVCPGACQGELEDSGNCTGVCLPLGASCPGVCSGNCDLLLGGPCDGVCLGECTAPASECGPDEQARCAASASESVPCLGTCNGRLSAPTTAACEANVTAFAAVAGRCVVPESIARYELTYETQIGLPSEELLQFDTQLNCYGFTIAAAATIGARSVALLAATQGLLSQASSVEDILFPAFANDPEDPQLTCGMNTLPRARTELEETSMQLSATVEATTSLAALNE